MPHDVAPTSEERVSGLARVALASVIWGTIPLVLRAADGAPTVKVFFRVFFAALVVGAWLLASGGWRELRTLGAGASGARSSRQGLLLTLNWFLFLTALDLTTVATAELLGYTGPVFVAVLTPFVTGERFDRRIVLPLGARARRHHRHPRASTAWRSGRAPRRWVRCSPFGSALTYAALLLRSKKIIRGHLERRAHARVSTRSRPSCCCPFVVAAYARGGGPSARPLVRAPS